MPKRWEPKCLEVSPVYLSDEEINDNLAEAAELLYVHAAKSDSLTTGLESPALNNKDGDSGEK